MSRVNSYGPEFFDLITRATFIILLLPLLFMLFPHSFSILTGKKAGSSFHQMIDGEFINLAHLATSDGEKGKSQIASSSDTAFITIMK